MARPKAPRFTWQILASGDDGPGPRSRHCLVYDANEEATVLVGGIIWGKFLDLQSDTWELRANHWTPIKTRPKPPARHRGAMVYDSRRGCSILFGGQGQLGVVFGDTWIYGGGRWKQCRFWWWNRPAARCGHSMAFDEATGKVVLFGGINQLFLSLGDTWLFDGASWQKVRGPGPPARRYAAFAYDPDLRGCVLHGGAWDDAGRIQYGDTWLFRNDAWTQLPTDFDTDNRDDHGLAYHRAAKKLIMLEGVGGARGVLARDDVGWQPVDAIPLHPRHQCSPLAWDDTLGGLLFHGGEVRHGGPQFDATWILRLIDSPTQAKDDSATTYRRAGSNPT